MKSSLFAIAALVSAASASIIPIFGDQKGHFNSKTTDTNHTFAAVRRILENSTPINTTLTRLNIEMKADTFVAGQLENVTSTMVKANNKQGYIDYISSRTNAEGLMLFEIRNYNAEFQWFDEFAPTPTIYTYTIGNPLLANSILDYDRSGGLHAPLRVALYGNETYSHVEYEVFNTVVAIGNQPTYKAEQTLKQRALGVDYKVDAILKRVLSDSY